MAIPMPNDRIGDAIVVASVYWGESDGPPVTETWAVLLLHPHPPFFQCALVTADELTTDFHVVELGERHFNIVHAVRDYEQQYGGDV